MKGGTWNVQEIVEKPQVYILGKADDSILEKLSYIETRAEDVKNLPLPTTINGQKIHDTLRFFQGDHPELQFESGNQQGGHFPCQNPQDTSCWQKECRETLRPFEKQ